MSFSSSSIEPCSLPSDIMALISSSVTALSLAFFMLKILKMMEVMPDSNQTNGCIIVERKFIGMAMLRAIFSARNKPNFFGINSPKMIDKKVTKITTTDVAIPSAYLWVKVICSK